MAIKKLKEECKTRTDKTTALIWRVWGCMLWCSLRWKGIYLWASRWKPIVNDRVCLWGRSDSDFMGSQSMRQAELQRWKLRVEMQWCLRCISVADRRWGLKCGQLPSSRMLIDQEHIVVRKLSLIPAHPTDYSTNLCSPSSLPPSFIGHKYLVCVQKDIVYFFLF